MAQYLQAGQQKYRGEKLACSKLVMLEERCIWAILKVRWRTVLFPHREEIDITTEQLLVIVVCRVFPLWPLFTIVAS